MSPQLPAGLEDWLDDGIAVISSDVFDTLLLRNHRAERSRTIDGERRFARLLAQRGWIISVDALFQARRQAQKLAFRALEMRGEAGEVRLADIVGRQLRVLGLPLEFAADRLAIEVEVEKSSLKPNTELAVVLRRQRKLGRRIIAISDTTLSSASVKELIEHFHGPDLIERVWSSADYGKTKRQGDIFKLFADTEGLSADQILHIGDDKRADIRVPNSLGIRAYHVRPSRLRPYLARFDGVVTEALMLARSRTPSAPRIRVSETETSVAFAREVLGPIVAQFCLLVWLYADQVKSDGDAVLLFCARGGIGIRGAFEITLQRCGLTLDLPRDNLMISRLVATRAALLTKSPAALDEIRREFCNETFAAVATAIGGRAYDLPPQWNQLFDAEQFFPLLYSDEGRELLGDIREQNDLFARHFSEVAGQAHRIILCDTGLYGSTQRLLAAGFPSLSIETLQFARANYKGYGEEHFPRVVGLMVQQNRYSALKAETCVLRYWQLIEDLFEPRIPSVRSFTESPDGNVFSNAGEARYRKFDVAAGNPLLTGALEYIENLHEQSGAKIFDDAQVAWHRLKRAITHPTLADVDCMQVGLRSADFGRPGCAETAAIDKEAKFLKRLASIKPQLWREGAIARHFPILKAPLLALLESVHAVRGIVAKLNR